MKKKTKPKPPTLPTCEFNKIKRNDECKYTKMKPMKKKAGPTQPPTQPPTPPPTCHCRICSQLCTNMVQDTAPPTPALPMTPFVLSCALTWSRIQLHPPLLSP